MCPNTIRSEDPSVGLAIDIESFNLGAWNGSEGLSVEMIVGWISFQCKEESREVDVVGGRFELLPCGHAAMGRDDFGEERGAVEPKSILVL